MIKSGSPTAQLGVGDRDEWKSAEVNAGRPIEDLHGVILVREGKRGKLFWLAGGVEHGNSH